MNFCGMPLALCMAETSRSQSSTMKASVLTSRKVRSCEWIPAPLLWIWSISRKLNIIATSTSSSTPRSSVTRSVIHGFSTSNLTSRRSTRRSSAGGYLGALDFFLTPAAEIPRLKGCLTCLLLDDIGPGGARASRCEVRNWQNSVSVHRAKIITWDRAAAIFSSAAPVPTAPGPHNEGHGTNTAAIRSRISDRV